MGQRNKQHMGKSTGDERDLVGRDVRGDDATADAAQQTGLPMPNEEGTAPADDTRTFSGQPRDDEETDRRLRQGGSGSSE